MVFHFFKLLAVLIALTEESSYIIMNLQCPDSHRSPRTHEI